MKNFSDPPSIVRPANELATLASQINAEHEAAVGAARNSLEHARAAGEALLRAKQRCRHGEWLPWLKANVRCDQKTAWRYMKVASEWSKLGTVPNLSLRDALELLASEEEREADLAQSEAEGASGVAGSPSSTDGSGKPPAATEWRGCRDHRYSTVRHPECARCRALNAENAMPSSNGSPAVPEEDRKPEGKRRTREPGDEDDLPGNPYMPTLNRCRKSLSKQHETMIRCQDVSTKDASLLGGRLDEYAKQFEKCAIQPERPIRPARKGNCRYCGADVLFATTSKHTNIALVESIGQFSASQPANRSERWDFDGDVAVQARGGRYRRHAPVCPKRNGKPVVSDEPLPD